MSSLDFRNDPGEGVAYLELYAGARPVARTHEVKHAGRELIVLDYDENGAIVGIEIVQ